jgi:membrane-associated phospholipid phosphatase
VFAVAAVVILSIALSRIYLGAHYLSDILGALAAGLVWLALCWTGVETFRKRRAFFKAGGGSN